MAYALKGSWKIFINIYRTCKAQGGRKENKKTKKTNAKDSLGDETTVGDKVADKGSRQEATRQHMQQ